MHRRPTALTISGVEKLRAKLQLLKNRHRSLTEALHDRSESNDILDIKCVERDLILSDIDKIQAVLSNMTILTQESLPDRAIQGTKVTYLQDETGYEYQIMLVDPLEADPLEGYISVESPVGSSLLGHQIGDTVTAATTRGSLHLTITGLE